jgi:hypothetical protein
VHPPKVECDSLERVSNAVLEGEPGRTVGCLKNPLEQRSKELDLWDELDRSAHRYC